MPQPDFDDVYERLCALFAPHLPMLAQPSETDGYYVVDTTRLHKKKPLMFGAVRRGKNYVSFHLMPVYGCPDLVAGLSPALRKRMQGKACFNFKSVDEPLFAELAELTRLGLERFQKGGYA